MSTLLHVARADSTTSEEQRQKYRARVREPFEAAHAAWDAYHQHLCFADPVTYVGLAPPTEW